jgi:hypothetical protein
LKAACLWSWRVLLVAFLGARCLFWIPLQEGLEALFVVT